MSESLVPVAQYLRMSTDHQQYSLDNQADAIARYAASHGFVVVRTYSDAAKSGVRIKNRTGLQQLLKDVVGGQAGFLAVLVYDVSRWGRFQDVDEAAHYEYLCKSSGVPVHYCVETFTNDDGMPHLIMKALKRTMAAEYSREMSVKCRAGLVRLGKMGFKLGGDPPYGLSRLLLDTSGRPKQLLARGERKSLANEHVILVPGPDHEVATVRRIFHEFADRRRGLTEIARRLNQDGSTFWTGSRWDAGSVTRVLRHPAYVGTLVWGRTSAYLSGPVKKVPPEQWLVRMDSFASLIDRNLFDRAQRGFHRFTHCITNAELLRRLQKLLVKHGKLTSRIIDQSRTCPGLTTYCRRFGNLLSIYELLGHRSPHEDSITFRVRSMLIRNALIRSVMDEFPGQFDEVRKSRRFRTILSYRPTGLLVAVVVAKYFRTAGGEQRWLLEPPRNERKRLTLVALLDEQNTAIERMIVFPLMNFPGNKTVRLSEGHSWMKTGIQIGQLCDLLGAINELRSVGS